MLRCQPIRICWIRKRPDRGREIGWRSIGAIAGRLKASEPTVSRELRRKAVPEHEHVTKWRPAFNQSARGAAILSEDRKSQNPRALSLRMHMIGYFEGTEQVETSAPGYYASFSYQAGSWTKSRRVVAKVEWHPGELCPRIGFIVTNLAQDAESIVAFYNKRGTYEQWIKEGKGAIN
jgi:hypothetical protein